VSVTGIEAGDPVRPAAVSCTLPWCVVAPMPAGLIDTDNDDGKVPLAADNTIQLWLADAAQAPAVAGELLMLIDCGLGDAPPEVIEKVTPAGLSLSVAAGAGPGGFRTGGFGTGGFGTGGVVPLTTAMNARMAGEPEAPGAVTITLPR
jgi:hypothetical protein